ncbi:MAG: undecaprenyldiphospho-muramoylpentapeptide beta-N-acetylglucosaminyltransferase [Selenomonadaceae bacterium]|nr:undecaprenyldiphospho-muramoylpentapeptide beta-N-acetylglucosaminyltransferase [Selenomonadaceae bacterium]
MRIIVSGGGTGGHIYPAITLIRAIREKMPEAEFLYVGTREGLEADIVPKEGLPFETVELRGFERHFTLDNFRRAGKAMMSVATAAKIVRRFRPDAAIGTGGYVCGPVLLAASLMHVPSLIQEQNVVPGITNRILARFVSRIAVGTKTALLHFPAGKAVCTGNPIRKEVLSATREEGLTAFGFDGARPIVLVSGGSRGARSINHAMVDVLQEAQHHPEVQFLHVTGNAEHEDILRRMRSAGVDLEKARHIHVVPYLYNMPQAMAMADLAVFRAGATGIAELTARGIPAILIPYPYAAENHQEYNARELEDAGAARMILNRDLNGDSLGAVLQELLSAPEKLREMAAASKAMGRPQAADEIADMVLELAGRTV